MLVKSKESKPPELSKLLWKSKNSGKIYLKLSNGFYCFEDNKSSFMELSEVTPFYGSVTITEE